MEKKNKTFTFQYSPVYWLVSIVFVPPEIILEVVPLWQRPQLQVLLNSAAFLLILLSRLLWVIWGWSAETPHSRSVVSAGEKTPQSHNGCSHPEKHYFEVSAVFR